MPTGHSVVIARPEHVASIKKRLGDSESITTISEPELVQVQQMVLDRRPSVLVLHSDFATTSRGATLVAAIKAADIGTSVRVFIEEDDTPLMGADSELPPSDVLLETSRPLERAGTRQAMRYPMDRTPLAINGEVGQLIDLSVSGAQVQTVFRLRPLKVARLVIRGGENDLRTQGTVAWATAVPAGGAIQYRAGIEFVNPDKQLLEEFCSRHGGRPDPTLGESARS